MYFYDNFRINRDDAFCIFRKSVWLHLGPFSQGCSMPNYSVHIRISLHFDVQITKFFWGLLYRQCVVGLSGKFCFGVTD